MQLELTVSVPARESSKRDAREAARRACQRSLRRQGESGRGVRLRLAVRGGRAAVEVLRGRKVLRWAPAPAQDLEESQAVYEARLWRLLARGRPCRRCRLLEGGRCGPCWGCATVSPRRARGEQLELLETMPASSGLGCLAHDGRGGPEETLEPAPLPVGA